jgi:hypothetical protein
MSFESEIKSDHSLSLGLLAYFRERQRNRIHQLLLSEFLKSGMTKTQLANRMGRSLSRVTKWLSAPGNWELDTVSDFFLAISGAELEPLLSYPFSGARRNYNQPEWLKDPVLRKQEDVKPDPSELGLVSQKKPEDRPITGPNLADQLKAA